MLAMMQLLLFTLPSTSTELNEQHSDSVLSNATADLSKVAWFCAISDSQPVPAIKNQHSALFKLGAAVEVRQGNANARSIILGSDHYLFTQDLTPCIALLIVDKKNSRCHMIHTDAFDTSSMGGVTLRTQLFKLGLDHNGDYSIGLIGGASTESIQKAEQKIKLLLPKANIILKELGKHAAYLSGDGSMATSKKALESSRSQAQSVNFSK